MRLERDAGHLVLEVADNGRGITDQELTGTRHFGLLGMRERAASAGGQLEIKGEPGKGTTVRAKIPVRMAGADG